MAGSGGEPPDLSDQIKKKICDICSTNIVKGGIKCANSECKVVLHVKCFQSASKVFNINRQDWRCKNCCSGIELGDIKSSETSDEILLKELECLKREVQLLNKLNDELQYNNKLLKDRVEDSTSTKTYAKTVSTPASDKVNTTKTMSIKTHVSTERSAVLLIKSQDTSIPNTEVMQEIKSSVNPSDNNICVNNTRLIKSGLLINCMDEDSLSRLKNVVADKFGSKYIVAEPKKLNPRLIIRGVDNNGFSDEDIIKSILLNNPELNNCKMKLITRIKRKFSTDIVIEVLPSVRKVIITKGYLFINWQKCYIEDHFLVMRCFKCSRYGHAQKDCISEKKCCPDCSGDHDKKNCNIEIKQCINCTNYNSRNKNSNVLTDHSALDKKCPYYLYQLDRLKSKINYGG